MHREPFNTDWYFQFGDLSGRPWKLDAINLDEWQRVSLPHDWSIERSRRADHPSGNSGGYFEMGRGYYMKRITPPADWAGKQVSVEFEGVYMNAEIWLDEHFITRHPYGYTSFLVDLTPYLRAGEEHILKVRVDNSTQLNSRWYSGSGIYRPVWLIVTEPVHVAHWGTSITTPEIHADAATAHVCTTIQNDSTEAADFNVRLRIFAPDGQEIVSAETAGSVLPHGRETVCQNLHVPAPQMWSPETPALYRLETEVVQAGRVIDRDTTTFGIRSLQFSAEHGFLLNGRPVKLKGGCVHHDNGILGATSFPRAEERKVEIHKASGYNAIRCAHNPPAPAFLDACDRLGMLVIDEAFDCWRDGKNLYDYHVEFDDWWQRDIDSMLLRDRNHPCIILWSIGNEVLERDRPEGASIAHMLAERVRSVDPTRPVTSAICGSWSGKDWQKNEKTFAALDVGGYNYQWKQYEPDHERFPQRMMVGTESFPLEALDNWMQVEAHPYVLGDFVWTSLDYLGESGIGRMRAASETEFLGVYPWHHANCGDLDLCGFKRPQSYYRDMVWNAGARLYIAVHPPKVQGEELAPTLWGWPDVWQSWNWAGAEGETFQVDVYSADEAVELFLNGRSLGRKPAGRDERHTATFEVPFEPGELRAVGYQGGEAVDEARLVTAGPAATLRLSPDRAAIQAAEGDLSYVTVELADADGNPQPADDRLIRFTVEGPGVLAAVGSGNPVSEEAYRGDRRTTFRGRCLAVVKSTGQPGVITLRAEGDGLRPAAAEIRASA